MTNRKTLLISLLILGLMLIGGGIWWKIYSSSSENTGKMTFTPIISMVVADDNVKSKDSLYICEDGNVYVIWEIEKRPEIGREWSKIYRKGQIQKSELDALIQLFRDNLDKLQDSYQYTGYPGTEGQIIKGHMDTVLTIIYGGLEKKVVATDYLGMYSSYSHPGSTYAGMPAPLDKVCKQLAQIGAATEEFYKETPLASKNE